MHIATPDYFLIPRPEPAPARRFLHPSFADRSADERTYLDLICVLQRTDRRTAERLLRDRHCARAAAPISRLACCYAGELVIGDVCLPTHPHLPVLQTGPAESIC